MTDTESAPKGSNLTEQAQSMLDELYIAREYFASKLEHQRQRNSRFTHRTEVQIAFVDDAIRICQVLATSANSGLEFVDWSGCRSDDEQTVERLLTAKNKSPDVHREITDHYIKRDAEQLDWEMAQLAASSKPYVAPTPNASRTLTEDAVLQTFVDVLDSAFKADPAAINALMCVRVPCNQALADHPTVIVGDSVAVEGGFTVTMLGVINGICDALTKHKVAARWTDEPVNVQGQHRMVGFVQYQQDDDLSTAQ